VEPLDTTPPESFDRAWFGTLGARVRRALEGDPADALARVLTRGGDIGLGEASTADVDHLVRAGLVAVRGGRAYALARVSAWDTLLYLHDAARNESEQDSVYGVGPNAKALLRMTPRMTSGTALDVGCGQGVHAFAAARAGAASVGTDVSRRAVHLARLGALLNGLDGATFRCGALFEPVAGARFDLVMCNAPFVFGETRHVRSGGGAGAGDEFTHALLREMPARLAPGGWGVVLCNWEHERDDDWHAPLYEDLACAPCDAWCVRLRTSRVDDVQARWFTDSNDPDVRADEGDAESLRRWRAHLGGRDRRLSMGFVFIRRRERGMGWFRADVQRLGPGDAYAGDQARRIMEGETLLRGLHAPEEILDVVFAPAVDLREEPGEGGLTYVEQARGLRFRMALEPPVRAVLAGFDGVRTAREVIRGVLGADGGPHAARVVLELVRRGFLLVPQA
jgi:SAM-dependent methyltransferase